jgi:hypothetical protein
MILLNSFIKRCCCIAFFIFCLVTPALANQPPGPGMSLPQILMLPMIALLTALGGGYAILRLRKRSRFIRIVRGGVITILFLLGFTHEGFSMLVTLIFGVLALVRGIRMIVWGAKPAKPAESAESEPSDSPEPGASPEKSPSQEPWPKVSRWRLITAGMLLSVVAIYLMGSALVFVNYWPDSYQYSQVEYLKKLLASEIAYGRTQKQQTGETRFHRIKPGEVGPWYYSEILLRHGNVRVDFSPDDKHFTIYILPYASFPPWPYRFWTNQGSYRADESGEIRMVRVREQNQICPPDAPVVMKVEESDIQDAMKGLNPAQQLQ